MCNRKTAILLMAGLAMLFLPGNLSYFGMALIALAYGLALMPGKSCRVDYNNETYEGN